jgi:hypothetical protein
MSKYLEEEYKNWIEHLTKDYYKLSVYANYLHSLDLLLSVLLNNYYYLQNKGNKEDWKERIKNMFNFMVDDIFSKCAKDNTNKEIIINE